MKIAVVGAGSMGSLFGGLLAQQKSNQVWLIDIWEEHINQICKYGLRIDENEKEKIIKVNATKRYEDVGQVDLVIIFVKAIHTEAAINEAKCLVDDDTIVLSLQNGLGNLETLSKVIGKEKVIGGVTYEGSRTIKPGHINHHIKAKTVIGELDGKKTSRVKKIVRIFESAGFETQVADNVLSLIWSKAVVNIPVNALTGITGLLFDEILEYKEATELVEETMRETLKITDKLGIELSFEMPLEFIKEHLMRIGPNKSSLLQDFEAGRKTEIEALNGEIVRLGKVLNIDTPYNKILTDLIKIIEYQKEKGI